MQDLNVTILMQSGDIVRFFHGEGPAQQFEWKHGRRNFCCVACGARSDRTDDIAYTYRYGVPFASKLLISSTYGYVLLHP